MRRWISFGLIVLVAVVAAANLASPGAWASDSHALYMTVPTRTPKPPDTSVPPTEPPEKENEPTDTPAPAPTHTPVVVNPATTATGVMLPLSGLRWSRRGGRLVGEAEPSPRGM